MDADTFRRGIRYSLTELLAFAERFEPSAVGLITEGTIRSVADHLAAAYENPGPSTYSALAAALRRFLEIRSEMSVVSAGVTPKDPEIDEG